MIIHTNEQYTLTLDLSLQEQLRWIFLLAHVKATDPGIRLPPPRGSCKWSAPASRPNYHLTASRYSLSSPCSLASTRLPVHGVHLNHSPCSCLRQCGTCHSPHHTRFTTSYFRRLEAFPRSGRGHIWFIRSPRVLWILLTFPRLVGWLFAL